MNSGKLAVRMLLPSTIPSAPPSPWLSSPLPSANSPLPLRLALTRLPILYQSICLSQHNSSFFLFSTGSGPLTHSPLVRNLQFSSPFTNLENPLPLHTLSAPFLSPLASPSFLSACSFSPNFSPRIESSSLHLPGRLSSW